MKTYKCICCGEMKKREKICTCANCGYKMYPIPYDRKQVLADEINSFIEQLKLDTIKPEEIFFFRQEPVSKKPGDDTEENTVAVSKSWDDQRFPDFDKIQGYVCAGRKTEEFFTRLSRSMGKLKAHLHEEYRNVYEAGYEAVKIRISALDAVLEEALKELGIKADLTEPVFPNLVLDYREAPNKELIGSADQILNMLDQLAEKIKKFIKVNNVYGAGYKKKIKPVLKQPGKKSDKEILDDVRMTVEKELNHKYRMDLFSDGSEELENQLEVLWTAVYVLMKLPVLEKLRLYQFGDGTVLTDDSFTTKIVSVLSERYADIQSPVLDERNLPGKTEDEVFEIYDKLIEMDSFGFMGVNSTILTHIGESEKKLNNLIGLSGIKNSIKKIKAYTLANKDSDALNIHMCFYGNPGTGKTEAARIIAGILYENKILKTKKIVEVDRGGLVGEYVGETPQKTMEKIKEAMGGVLFIDEAYALVPRDSRGRDFGYEAVATLIKAMEDYRGKFCVILAGYKNQMLEMLSSNPGFKSRIQFELEFPNYSRDELKQISSLILKKRNYSITEGALETILDITDVKRKEANFANAREVRNILDQVIMCQNVRTAGTDDHELGTVDVRRYIIDSKIILPVSGSGTGNKILTGEEELDRLTGLKTVKRMIKKIKAYAKKNKDDSSFNLHMCFYGNPGTGKTEVARILSRILYDAGVLSEAKLVETDSTGLLGKFVGETGPKTQEKVQDAMGGVLFIDEAYGLAGSDFVTGASSNYGDEAITVLLKAMEDYRGRFCVIMAGYKDEMRRMLGENPGFESRIQFYLDFPDYTREELGEIAKSFAEVKKYQIEESALDKLLDVTEYFRQTPNFANARTVRNILDQVIMNQNLRSEDDEDDRMIIVSDVEDFITDENIDLDIPAAEQKIGFRID